MESPQKPSRFSAIRRTILYALALLGLLVLIVSFTPITSILATQLAGPWNDPKGDVLIVLGGGTYEDGVLSEASYLRARYAVEAWHQGGFRKIVISGGGEPPDSPAMEEVMLTQGISASSIVLEAKSRNTRENALFTQALLTNDHESKVLMTSDYHMFRAQRAFLKAGLRVLPRPIPDVRKRSTRWMGRWPAFLDLLQEYGKILYYKARGWI